MPTLGIGNFKEIITREFLPCPRRPVLLDPHTEVPYLITPNTKQNSQQQLEKIEIICQPSIINSLMLIFKNIVK